MKQPTLFALPPPGPTRAARVAAFVKEHGILTHTAGRPIEERFMALLPVDEHKGMDIGEVMAKYCRLYDESARVVTARSMLAAVRELARLNSIPCDL